MYRQSTYSGVRSPGNKHRAKTLRRPTRGKVMLELQSSCDSGTLEQLYAATVYRVNRGDSSATANESLWPEDERLHNLIYTRLNTEILAISRAGATRPGGTDDQ